MITLIYTESPLTYDPDDPFCIVGPLVHTHGDPSATFAKLEKENPDWTGFFVFSNWDAETFEFWAREEARWGSEKLNKWARIVMVLEE